MSPPNNCQCRRVTSGFVVLVLALAAGIGFALKFLSPSAPTPANIAPQAVETLFATRLIDTTGRMQALADWRGKLLVVNFWASWCSPCREEIPGFLRLQQKYRNDGVQFVGIAMENAPEVAAFIERFPISYPILIDDGKNHELMRQLGNTSLGLPYTIVVDAHGRVMLAHVGLLAEAQLDTRLDTLLRQTTR